jgi:hypothetical protein
MQANFVPIKSVAATTADDAMARALPSSPIFGSTLVSA